MSRRWEIQDKINKIIDTRKDELKEKHKAQIPGLTDALYKKWGILTEMKKLELVESQMSELTKMKNAIEAAINQKYEGYGHYNFRHNSEEKAMEALPAFRQLNQIKNKLELAILLASSSKQLVALFNDFTKEIDMV